MFCIKNFEIDYTPVLYPKSRKLSENVTGLDSYYYLAKLFIGCLIRNGKKEIATKRFLVGLQKASYNLHQPQSKILKLCVANISTHVRLQQINRYGLKFKLPIVLLTSRAVVVQAIHDFVFLVKNYGEITKKNISLEEAMFYCFVDCYKKRGIATWLGTYVKDEIKNGMFFIRRLARFRISTVKSRYRGKPIIIRSRWGYK